MKAELVIHTPGHSAYTDTLMMYALAYSAGDRLKRVSGNGFFYTLEIVELEPQELAERLSGTFTRNFERLHTQFSKLLSENDLKKAARTLENEELLTEYLKELIEPGHAWREGRAGKGESFKLPLMPAAGKYLRADLTASKKYLTKEYAVCSFCSAIALLGLALGTLTIYIIKRQRKQKINTYLVNTLKFDGEVDGSWILELVDYYVNLSDEGKRLFEDSRSCLEELPERLFGYLIPVGLSDRLVSAMVAARARWSALITRFDVVRVVQVRGYYTVELDSALASLSELIKMDEEKGEKYRSKFNSLCETLLRACSVEALERLFDFMSTRDLGKMYQFTRIAYSDLKQAHKNFHASELIEALAHLCTGT